MTIVVTRPEEQAVALIALLASRGLASVLFPLLVIQPLEDCEPIRRMLARLDEFDLAIFVSPNAVEHAFKHLPATGWPTSLPIGVVGQGSVAALANHGIVCGKYVIYAPMSAQESGSEALLAQLALNRLVNKRVLLVRGSGGRELLTEQLSAAGAEVISLSTYQRLAPELDIVRRQLLATLVQEANDWIVTSSEALRHFDAMIGQAALSESAVKSSQRLIVPHSRIAETACELGFRHVTLAGPGDLRLADALHSSI